MLVKTSRVKKFQHSLSFSFLTEMVKSLKKSQIKHIIWAQLESDLSKPWNKQTRDSLMFFLTLQEFHPSIANKILGSTCIGNEGVITAVNANHLIEIIWSGTSIMTINHPIYELFPRFLADSSVLNKIWSKIDIKLESLTKMNEIITVRVVSGIFKATNKKPNELTSIISNNFIQMIINRYSNLKQKNTEVFLEFYKEMFQNISSFLKKSLEAGHPCLEFLKLWILHPGQLTFDRLTSSDLVNSTLLALSENELKEFVEILKNIAVGVLEKGNGEKWLNTEKTFAAQTIAKLLSQKSVSAATEWKQEQLVFLFNLGFFKTSNGVNLVTKTEKDCGSNSFKSSFYRGLDLKHRNLNDERDALLQIVEHINTSLNSKHGLQYLRSPLSEDGFKAWKEMYETVNQGESKKSKRKNIQLVINIILLHMGLQLFNDEKMAKSAIDELKSCVERISAKKREDEPEWIEVVTDLFLHLLSYNSGLLRNVVVKVFPSLCPLLTISSLNQILSVLDMTEGYNPLTDVETQEEDGDDDDDNDNKDEKSDDEAESENEDKDDSESDDDDNESEDNSLMDDEGTVSTQLRTAISTALGTMGPDTDAESIDLDDMDDEEAKRLDDALAQAFKQYSEKRRSKKPSKKERIALTSASHFRVRVLDLIDIYIKTNPKLSFLTEILMRLFELLNDSAKDGGPVFQRTQQLLNKLTIVKPENIEDVTDEQICEIFRNLVTKKFTVTALTKRNEFLPKCCNFIINCSEILSKESGQESVIIEVIKEHLTEFINNRYSLMPLNVFTSIFQLQWNGIWDLCKILLKELNNKIRAMRCSQILGLFRTLYKNHRFLLQNVEISQKKLEKIENKIVGFITNQVTETTITQKVFGELLETIMTLNKSYRYLKQFEIHYDITTITENVQTIRQNLHLDSARTSYKKFCNQNSLKVIENKPQENGKQDDIASSDNDDGVVDEDGTKVILQNGKDSSESGNKRKRISKNKIKSKKLKKELRLKASSEGVQDKLAYSKLKNVNVGESVESDGVSTEKKKKKIKLSNGSAKN